MTDPISPFRTDDERIAWAIAFNAKKDAFWRDQNIAMERQISDPVVSAYAAKRTEDERQRCMPVKLQQTLELELQWAEDAKKAVVADGARQAGKGRKPDQLQVIVNSLVKQNPSLELSDLIVMLRERCPGPDIVDIDEGMNKIILATTAGDKAVAYSGLKGRLTRARAKLARNSTKDASERPGKGKTAPMTDPILFGQARKRYDHAKMRGLSGEHRPTIKHEIQWAEGFKIEVVSAQARKGGSVRKLNPLQALMNDIVACNPQLSFSNMIAALKQQCPGPVIAEINEVENEVVLTAEAGGQIVTFSGLRKRFTTARGYAKRNEKPSATSCSANDVGHLMT